MFVSPFGLQSNSSFQNYNKFTTTTAKIELTHLSCSNKIVEVIARNLQNANANLMAKKKKKPKKMQNKQTKSTLKN